MNDSVCCTRALSKFLRLMGAAQLFGDAISYRRGTNGSELWHRGVYVRRDPVALADLNFFFSRKNCTQITLSSNMRYVAVVSRMSVFSSSFFGRSRKKFPVFDLRTQSECVSDEWSRCFVIKAPSCLVISPVRFCLYVHVLRNDGRRRRRRRLPARSNTHVHVHMHKRADGRGNK